MAEARDQIGEIVLRQALDGEGVSSDHPTVLSCGGIFIPRRDESEDRLLYQILNTPSEKEPVKIVTGVRPRNALYDVLMKESLN